VKLAKIPQLGAQSPGKPAQRASTGFGAVLADVLKPRAKAAKSDRPVAAADKKPAQAATADALVTQLAHAQALVPQAPLHVPHHAKKHEKHADAPAPLKLAATTAERAELPAPTRELSAQPAAIFTLSAEAPRETAKAEAPPPVWAPKEVVADDTARLTVFPHSANLTAEGHALHLQVREGEVSIRARGELAAQLRSSESELRVALAQEGLKLRETEATTQDEPEHHQRRKERDDEWT